MGDTVVERFNDAKEWSRNKRAIYEIVKVSAQAIISFNKL